MLSQLTNKRYPLLLKAQEFWKREMDSVERVSVLINQKQNQFQWNQELEQLTADKFQLVSSDFSTIEEISQ